jgi:hypothetical protein
VYGQPALSREYEVKAAFLLRFTQFVDWPAHVLPHDRSPLIIGVLGENPFGNHLSEIVSGETTKGHPVIVRHYNDVEDIETCHVLYINLPADKIETAIRQLKGHSVLTVSDNKGFLKAGGMIRLLSENNKIRFRVNLYATQIEHLVLSSKLLRLADIYIPNLKK